MRGTVLSEAGRVKTARSAGVVFGDTLKESENPRVDVLRTPKEARGAVGEGKLQGPGSRGPEVEGERGEPNVPLPSPSKHTEGSHDSMRGRRSGGNDGQAAGGAIRVDL